MTLEFVLYFAITLLLLTGVWDCIEIKIITKVYRQESNGEERFLDFCMSRFSSGIWRFRKRLHIDWFYNSKAFVFSTVLIGVLKVLFAIGLIYFIFYLNSHEMNYVLKMHW